MNDITKILVAARDLVARGWTTGAMARDADGNEVSCLNADATCFCAMGAVLRASYDLGFRVSKADQALIVLTDLTPGHESVVTFNDNSSQGDVIKVLDRAIKAQG